MEMGGVYTPFLQICEMFPYSDEGWEEARSIEYRVIRQDLNNPLCLNERCGGHTSIELSRKGGRVISKRNMELQLGLFQPGYLGSRDHREAARKGGKIGGLKSKPNLEKCALGGSIGGKISGRDHKLLGRGIFSEAYLESDKYRETRIKGAKGLHDSKWMDPDHPELGCHHVNTLKKLQRKHGYPDKKENRVKYVGP